MLQARKMKFIWKTADGAPVDECQKIIKECPQSSRNEFLSWWRAAENIRRGYHYWSYTPMHGTSKMMQRARWRP